MALKLLAEVFEWPVLGKGLPRPGTHKRIIFSSGIGEQKSPWPVLANPIHVRLVRGHLRGVAMVLESLTKIKKPRSVP